MLSTFGNILGRPLSWFTGGWNDNTMESPRDSEFRDENVDPYEPSILDVLVVKAMLNKALALPPELLNTIIDLAEYWPHSSTELSGGLPIFGGRGGREDVFLLRSEPLGFTKTPQDPGLDYETTPLPSRPLRRRYDIEALQEAINSPEPLLAHPCRKIVFTINSHDQGWGGDHRHHGTYEGSWTWFSAGIETFDATRETGEDIDAPPKFSLTNLRSVWPEVRPVLESNPQAGYEFHHDLAPDDNHKIQANVLARRTTTQHRVEWSWTDDIDPSIADTRLEELVKAGRGRGTGNGEFVRSLTLGDVVTVWGHARFAAWKNFVESVRIDIYWAV